MHFQVILAWSKVAPVMFSIKRDSGEVGGTHTQPRRPVSGPAQEIHGKTFQLRPKTAAEALRNQIEKIHIADRWARKSVVLLPFFFCAYLSQRCPALEPRLPDH